MGGEFRPTCWPRHLEGDSTSALELSLIQADFYSRSKRTEGCNMSEFDLQRLQQFNILVKIVAYQKVGEQTIERLSNWR
jgi:hypothetical protein